MSLASLYMIYKHSFPVRLMFSILTSTEACYVDKAVNKSLLTACDTDVIVYWLILLVVARGTLVIHQ